MDHFKTLARIAIQAICWGASAVVAGPISTLYLTSDGAIYAWQGNALVNSWETISDTEFALAVDSTVRTYNQSELIPTYDPSVFLGSYSHEYSLNGTATGAIYTNTFGCCFRDGTTDGVHNYATREYPNGPTVFRFNLDWTNPEPITVQVGNFFAFPSGITYDPRTDSFWLIDQRTILNMDKAGAILSIFFIEFDESLYGTVFNPYALAFDSADNTLWLFEERGIGATYAAFLHQFSTAHTKFFEPNWRPLSSQQIGFRAYGGEFALSPGTPVPEPGSFMLLLTGLGGLALAGALRPSRRCRARRALPAQDPCCAGAV